MLAKKEGCGGLAKRFRYIVYVRYDELDMLNPILIVLGLENITKKSK